MPLFFSSPLMVSRSVFWAGVICVGPFLCWKGTTMYFEPSLAVLALGDFSRSSSMLCADMPSSIQRTLASRLTTKVSSSSWKWVSPSMYICRRVWSCLFACSTTCARVMAVSRWPASFMACLLAPSSSDATFMRALMSRLM
jgi:hypothetical protein